LTALGNGSRPIDCTVAGQTRHRAHIACGSTKSTPPLPPLQRGGRSAYDVPWARCCARMLGQATRGLRGQATHGLRGQATRGLRRQATRGLLGQATRGLRGQATRGLPGQGIWAEQKAIANPEAGRPPLWRGGRGGADPAIPPAWPARCSTSRQLGRRIGNHQRPPTALVGQLAVELRDPAEHLFTDAHICKGCADSPVRLPERGDSDTHRLGGIQTPTDSWRGDWLAQRFTALGRCSETRPIVTADVCARSGSTVVMSNACNRKARRWWTARLG
jgi:hypothetical protein